MKKFNAPLLVVTLLFAGTMLASDVPERPSTKSLSAQIGSLLYENPFVVTGRDLIADVKFTINENREIVILTVQTSDPILANFLKSRLNYTKVLLKDFKEGRFYTVPVRITA